MKIAVSGASGYLGTHIISQLLKEKNTVLGITRKTNKELEKISLENPQNFSLCELINDDLFLMMQNFSPDVVFSTTCCYETDVKFLEKTVDSNYGFPSQLMKSIMQTKSTKKNACRYINISTSLPSSLNLYSLTKKQFSELGEFYSKTGSVQFVNIMLEAFYGSDEPKNRFIHSSISKLLADKNLDVTEGRQRRDYIAIDDVVAVLCFLAKTDSIKNNFENISLGSGTSPSIREILEYLKDTCNSKSEIHFGAVQARLNEPSTVADLTRLRELGYKKEMTYWKDGMKKMVEAIKK